jgi:ornithine decarboxylase
MRLYQQVAKAFYFGKIYYAIKANPAPQVLRLLVDLGSCYDVASLNEIKLCLQAGAKPSEMMFGNTIKKSSEIAEAWQLGVKRFTYDTESELDKIAEHAPGAEVICRIMTDGAGASWPLSRKFGCTDERAVELIEKSVRLGLKPIGISFHVGSQMLVTEAWNGPITRAGELFKAMKLKGIELRVLNIGGGFPAHYDRHVPDIEEFADKISDMLHQNFEGNWPEVILEPGRAIVAEAGVVISEVLTVSHNRSGDLKRWVFLDVGKFRGFFEAGAIRYTILTDKDSDPKSPSVVAGPTCDSEDVMYESEPYELPDTLVCGDKVQFLSAGAYTTTYATNYFNGFAPMQLICLD